MSKAITWYRGVGEDRGPTEANWDGWLWLTTDPSHACIFGDAWAMAITGGTRTTRIDATRWSGGAFARHVRLYARAAKLAAKGFGLVVVKGWEGNGVCGLALPSAIDKVECVQRADLAE
jgi:hypothetical protein